MGIRLFFIGLMVTALAGGGFYVLKLQKDNAILKANAIKLESAISEQKTLIENQKKDFEAILSANKELNDLMNKLKTDFAELDKRFKRKGIGSRASGNFVSIKLGNGNSNSLLCPLNHLIALVKYSATVEHRTQLICPIK
mgnify:CR=1 FL=1